jgi:hypothetical protein
MITNAKTYNRDGSMVYRDATFLEVKYTYTVSDSLPAGLLVRVQGHTNDTTPTICSLSWISDRIKTFNFLTVTVLCCNT